MKRNLFYFLLLFLFISKGEAFAQHDVVNTIVLDAGHGGKDPGALGTGRYKKTEKDIALDVTLKVGNYLKEAFPNVNILYTRTADTFPTLRDRTELANQKDADLFISIHCDSFGKSSARGTSSHVMGLRYTEENLRLAQKENSVIFLEDNYEENYDGFDPSSPESIIAFSLSQTTYLNQSILIAQKIQEQFRTRVNRRDRGVKQTPLWVTRKTTMPSVLVELGFISNPEEEDFLNSENGQNYMASAIYRAIKEYKNELELIQTNNTLDTSKSTSLEKNIVEDGKDVIIQKNLVYKVQISSSLKSEYKNKVGVYEVNTFKEGDIFKHTVGNESTLLNAQTIKENVVEMGYDDAFIIAFYNGKKIKLFEAINIQKNNSL